MGRNNSRICTGGFQSWGSIGHDGAYYIPLMWRLSKGQNSFGRKGKTDNNKRWSRWSGPNQATGETSWQNRLKNPSKLIERELSLKTILIHVLLDINECEFICELDFIDVLQHINECELTCELNFIDVLQYINESEFEWIQIQVEDKEDYIKSIYTSLATRTLNWKVQVLLNRITEKWTRRWTKKSLSNLKQ